MYEIINKVDKKLNQYNQADLKGSKLYLNRSFSHMNKWNHTELGDDTFDEMPSLRSDEEKIGLDEKTTTVKRKNSFSAVDNLKIEPNFEIDVQ